LARARRLITLTFPDPELREEFEAKILLHLSNHLFSLGQRTLLDKRRQRRQRLVKAARSFQETVTGIYGGPFVRIDIPLPSPGLETQPQHHELSNGKVIRIHKRGETLYLEFYTNFLEEDIGPVEHDSATERGLRAYRGHGVSYMRAATEALARIVGATPLDA